MGVSGRRRGIKKQTHLDSAFHPQMMSHDFSPSSGSPGRFPPPLLITLEKNEQVYIKYAFGAIHSLRSYLSPSQFAVAFSCDQWEEFGGVSFQTCTVLRQ